MRIERTLTILDTYRKEVCVVEEVFVVQECDNIQVIQSEKMIPYTQIQLPTPEKNIYVYYIEVSLSFWL